MPIRERLQQRRFPTLADEAVVSLLVAADHFDQAVAPVWEQHGITADQYNVLRILRGVHPDGHPRLPTNIEEITVGKRPVGEPTDRRRPRPGRLDRDDAGWVNILIVPS